tara:strand:- start:1159 stop:1326 length:168 start_codon:yes stop_codon:yes gene_type:complete
MNTYEIELTQEELNALVALIDLAVKASGLQSVKAASAIIAKLEDSSFEVAEASED